MKIKFIKTKENENYSAQGFVEALIAILITGIVAMIFMTIAAKTISGVVKNETIDQLTQEGVHGSSVLRYIVEQWNFGNRDVISSNLLINDEAGTIFEAGKGSCFAIDGDVVDPYISQNSVCNYIDGQGINPSDCLSDWDEVAIGDAGSEDSKLFRIVCTDGESNLSKRIWITRTYTGFYSCSEYDEVVREVNDLNQGCNIYEYISVFQLEP